VVKSNRRRKQDRTKRQASAARRRRAAVERRLDQAAFRLAEQRFALVRDPGTPVEEVASLILDQHSGDPVIPGLAILLRDYRGSADDVVRVAEAMWAVETKDGSEPSLSALTFGAQAAHLVGDFRLARARLDRALENAEDSSIRLELAAHLRVAGRFADAVEVAAAHVANPAYDSGAATMHGGTLEDAERRLADQSPARACECGSGIAWSECCRPREAAAIERFLDRSGLYALRTAIVEYLPRSPYEGPVKEHVADWLETADSAPWEPLAGEREPMERLAIEHAWIAAGIADPDGDGDDDRDDRDNVLTALASDPATAPEIAARAEAWRDHVRYGLWQVPDPVPAPGLWCVEVCTGQELYVAFAPEQIEQLARWSVLLGALVPIDGAWRATGALVRVSPHEADALCERIQAATEVVVGGLAGRENKRAANRLQRPASFGRAAPHSVYAYEQDRASPAAAALISTVTGALLPRLVAEVHASRATPPSLTNTDGDPLCMISARLAVRDAASVMARLAAHPDFEAQAEDASRLTWLGDEVPAAQRKAMLAEAVAQLQAQGHTDIDTAGQGEANRWVRGFVQLRGSELAVEVNSRQRLAGIVAALDKIGAEPAIVEESRVDPRLDLPWSGGHLPMGGGLASPEDGWEQQWLDEPVPALRGRTPRQAASSAERPMLEALLRQLEYDADLLAQAGQRGADARWLREHLDMPPDRL
jgi:hypothetical protein